MKYSLKQANVNNGATEWQHFHVCVDSNGLRINGRLVQLKKLQSKYYVKYDNAWQRIYLPAQPNLETIIGNTPCTIFQGFIPQGQDDKNKGNLKTAMPGKIVKVLVKVGDSVDVNQTLIILEAMKMENEIKATVSGIVKEIFISENQLVDSNVQLMEIE